mgnify:CR=1 FL=1
MSTIGFNLPGVPFKATSNVPDYVDALSKGFDMGNKPAKLSQDLLAQQLSNSINRAKAKFAPQREQADLESTRTGTSLNNLRMQQLRNELEQNALFNNMMSGMNGSQLRPNVQIDSLNGDSESISPKGIQPIDDFSDNGMSAEGPGIAKSASAYDTFPGRRKNALQSSTQSTPSLQDKISNGLNESNKNILEQGNPNLYKIDDMYDNYPQFRKQLESKGFKKTQTVKFDPKTGMTSVLTQYPSGKVEAKMLGSMNGDFSPATIANKTQSQKVINAIGNARPIIQKIIDENKAGKVPGQLLGKYFSPDKQASYISDVIQSSDTLAGALGFPGTNEGLSQAKETVLRKPRESDAGYNKRLENLLKDMDTREKTAMEVLKSGVSTKVNNKSEENITRDLTYNPATGRLE